MELKALLEVRSKHPSRRRKGRVLAIMLLGMLAGILTVATYNAVYTQSQYYLSNSVFIVLLLGLLVLNRLGFVYLAGLSTVALTGVGSLVLIGDQLSAAFITMPIPILIASSLLAPWAGFIVAAIMIAAAAVFHVATLSLLTLFIVAIISYLFADSLESAYRESRYQALHDPLTDLPNRALFLDRLEQELASAEQAGRVVAVLFIDLDNFKVINDSLGHHLGDRLLVEVSWRIRNCLRSRDSAARFGGDEFTILLANLWDAGSAVRVTQRLLEALREPFVIAKHEVTVSASVGIAMGNGDTARPSDLLRNADMALYQAKRAKGRYEVFHPSMHTRTLKRLKLEEDLRRAIERGSFEVHYQPQVTLDTRTISEMEALLRWGHPRRGLVMPSEFIQVTEETGLIVPIGEQVLAEACRRAREWHHQNGHRHRITMCVNLSMRQLQDPDLVDKVERALHRAALDANELKLEITETMVMEDEQHVVGVLKDLSALGVRISLDDFGSGYSSLNYVKDLPVDELKIDKSFIDGLGEDAVNDAIVRLIVDFAHTLGLKVTAEGVENGRQVASLAAMRCDQAQGFYFSEPLPSKEAGALVATDPSWWVSR
ncbi:MAG: EAL domain-containing protein [Actinomycetota bacterium]|nr:EAL domain-containing protein [Actinomycetota bacterium]